MKKVFIVTGVGKEQSLGTKILNRLPNDFVKVAIVHPDLAREVSNSGIKVDEIIDCDLSSEDYVNFAIDEIKEKFPEISGLINVAGYNKLSWIKDMDWDEHNRMMMVNCTAPCMLIQGLLPELTAAKGTVLNIISMGAVRPFRASHSYNVSKAAYRMATLQMARELTKSNEITIFGISPNDLIGTGMTEQLKTEIADIRGWTLEEAEAYRQAGAVNPRMTDPDELAKFIAYIMENKDRHHQFSGVELQYGI